MTSSAASSTQPVPASRRPFRSIAAPPSGRLRGRPSCRRRPLAATALAAAVVAGGERGEHLRGRARGREVETARRPAPVVPAARAPVRRDAVAAGDERERGDRRPVDHDAAAAARLLDPVAHADGAGRGRVRDREQVDVVRGVAGAGRDRRRGAEHAGREAEALLALGRADAAHRAADDHALRVHAPRGRGWEEDGIVEHAEVDEARARALERALAREGVAGVRGADDEAARAHVVGGARALRARTADRGEVGEGAAVQRAAWPNSSGETAITFVPATYGPAAATGRKPPTPSHAPRSAGTRRGRRARRRRSGAAGGRAGGASRDARPSRRGAVVAEVRRTRGSLRPEATRGLAHRLGSPERERSLDEHGRRDARRRHGGHRDAAGGARHGCHDVHGGRPAAARADRALRPPGAAPERSAGAQPGPARGGARGRRAASARRGPRPARRDPVPREGELRRPRSARDERLAGVRAAGSRATTRT